ncbi:hypothetical protein [Nocardia brasiliensis]|uniref:hypothetical protein n=1 Tax=Nocardia brasiliensis TaxID=37326 RepID=UPI0004A6CC1F|nr:hypothetical protein [Nocardia brasiliensis]
MPLVHRIRSEKIAELRELAARTLAETHEPGWPYDGGGPGVWSANVEALLGGRAGAYCGAVHPDLLITLLDELERLRKEVPGWHRGQE